MESNFHTATKPKTKLEEQFEKLSLTSIVNDHRTPRTSRQRLIPLTPQVIKAMMDFNGSQSSTSLCEKNAFYSTFSITSLVREEVQNILHELCLTEQFIRKEEIDALIELCLREKVHSDHNKTNNKSRTTTSTESLPNEEREQEIEVTVELVNETDKNKLIVENFQILEQRITNLEERISTVLQTLPKLRNLQAKKFKINTEVLREELRNIIQKMIIDEATVANIQTNSTASTPEGGNLSNNKDDNKSQTFRNKEIHSKIANINVYDDLYYAQRQNDMNMLNYKKSRATMALNQRPQLNPYIKPILGGLDQLKFKPKRNARFIHE